VPADLRIDVAHQLVELANLAGRTLDDVALRLERRDFCGHAVGQRLERRQLPFGLDGFGCCRREVLERLADRSRARLGLRDAALHVLLAVLERAHARSDCVARLAQLFLTRAHLVKP
jgi:hypothetical protein